MGLQETITPDVRRVDGTRTPERECGSADAKQNCAHFNFRGVSANSRGDSVPRGVGRNGIPALTVLKSHPGTAQDGMKQGRWLGRWGE